MFHFSLTNFPFQSALSWKLSPLVITKMLLPDLGCCMAHWPSPLEDIWECPDFVCLVPTIVCLNPAPYSVCVSVGHSAGCMPLCVFSLACKYAEQLNLSFFKTWALLFWQWLDYIAGSTEESSILFTCLFLYLHFTPEFWRDFWKNVGVSFFFSVLVCLFFFFGHSWFTFHYILF